MVLYNPLETETKEEEDDSFDMSDETEALYDRFMEAPTRHGALEFLFEAASSLVVTRTPVEIVFMAVVSITPGLTDIISAQEGRAALYAGMADKWMREHPTTSNETAQALVDHYTTLLASS